MSWKDEAKQRRLPAPVMGRWDNLESSLKQSAIAEVYIAGNPAKNGEAMQAPSVPASASVSPSHFRRTGSA